MSATRTAAPLRLGITGYPLVYTRSPAIHRGFLRAARRKGSYETLPFDPKRGRAAFFAFLDARRAEGFHGLNVTIPLKEWAYDYCLRRGAGVTRGFEGRCARLVGAANTIVFSKAGPRAANTDAAGLWDELASWLGRPALRGTPIVIIGTGGAARGAIAGILAGHAGARATGAVTVWGRDQAKARALARAVGRRAGGKARRRDRRNARTLVLWCLPPVSAREARRIFSVATAGARAWFYDLNYAGRASATAGLVPASRRRTGLGMLRRQARASFALWLAAR